MSEYKVFYTPKMVADSGCFSPSAFKPKQVVEDWRAAGLDFDVIEPEPATLDELTLAHDQSYVMGVLDGRIDNGFGNRSAEVAAALPYTTGAMLSAARYVRDHGGIAAAPCAGFHHAGPANAKGYCTFNGLMVTALALRQTHPHIRVGILDCDQHYGNGTDEILDAMEKRGEDTSWVHHFTVGASDIAPSQADHWLTLVLPAILKTHFQRQPRNAAHVVGVDILLYQAGADPHVNDPHGGWMTTEELAVRDRKVFRWCRKQKLVCVWNLAGGYQKTADGGIGPVLEIHRNTAKAWTTP